MEEDATAGPGALVPQVRPGPAAPLAQHRGAAPPGVPGRAAAAGRCVSRRDRVRRGRHRVRPQRAGRGQPARRPGLVACWCWRRSPTLGGAVAQRRGRAPRLRPRHLQRVLPAGRGVARRSGRSGSRSTGWRWRHAPAVLGHPLPTAAGRCCTATGRSPPGWPRPGTPGTARPGWSCARSGTPSATQLIDALLTPFPPVAAGAPAAARGCARAGGLRLRADAAHPGGRARPAPLRRRRPAPSCWPATPATPTSRSTRPGRG